MGPSHLQAAPRLTGLAYLHIKDIFLPQKKPSISIKRDPRPYESARSTGLACLIEIVPRNEQQTDLLKTRFFFTGVY